MRATQYLIDTLELIRSEQLNQRERAAYYDMLRRLHAELGRFLNQLDESSFT